MTMTAAEVQKEREKRLKKRGGKRPWFKMEEGTAYIRIGPPWKKGGEVWKDVYFHGHWPKKVYCAQNDKDETTGKTRRCRVCKRLEELKGGERSERSKILFGLISQRNEGLWNILIAKVKKTEDGSVKAVAYTKNRFHIWRLSGNWHNALLDVFTDEDYRRKSILGVTHSKYGRLIRVRRTGAELDTEYSFKALDRESMIFKDKDKRIEILKTCQDLDEVVSGSGDEELEAFLHQMEKKAKRLAAEAEEEGGEDEDIEDEDKEDRLRKKSHDDEEEEAEEEDSEEDEEEEEEDSDEGDSEKKYRKMKKSLKHEKEEEDEEESEEEDEED